MVPATSRCRFSEPQMPAVAVTTATRMSLGGGVRTSLLALHCAGRLGGVTIAEPW